jgi:predicted GNAT superfamily acetyltransferase
MIGEIFIAGNESALLSAIEAETAKRTESYVLAPISNRFSGAEPQPSPKGIEPEVRGSPLVPRPTDGSQTRILDWNPGSPISARTLVIAAENRLGHINEAILVCNPPQVRRDAANLNFADVEMLVNDHIKGWFFIVKELTVAFKARGEGTLSLVYPDIHEAAGGEQIPDFLGHSALAVFCSLTRNLLSAAFSEPFLTMGFTGVDDAGFAAFIFKQLEEKNRRGNGKLHKYGSKLGFFK